MMRVVRALWTHSATLSELLGAAFHPSTITATGSSGSFDMNKDVRHSGTEAGACYMLSASNSTGTTAVG